MTDKEAKQPTSSPVTIGQQLRAAFTDWDITIGFWLFDCGIASMLKRAAVFEIGGPKIKVSTFNGTLPEDWRWNLAAVMKALAKQDLKLEPQMRHYTPCHHAETSKNGTYVSNTSECDGKSCVLESAILSCA